MLMMTAKKLILSVLFTIVLCSGQLQAGNSDKMFPLMEQFQSNQSTDSLKWSVRFLNKLLYSCNEWYLNDDHFKKPIQGVLNYAENDPLDTVVFNLRKLLKDGKVVYLINRHPEDIRNLKDVPGYVSEEEMAKRISNIRKDVFNSLNDSNIVIPMMVMESGLSKAPHVPDGEPNVLLGRQKELPPEFVKKLNLQISALRFPSNVTGFAMDSTINQLFNNYRKIYNDSIQLRVRDKINFNYRTNYISERTELRIKEYKKSVADQNASQLAAYNEKTVGIINDSLRIALQYLAAHAETDSTLIRLSNLNNEQTSLWTANRFMKPLRMFVKNAQQDSISVALINSGKGVIKLIIDDGVILTRFSKKQNRYTSFETKDPDKKLKKVELKKVVLPPWTLRGNGSLGFTQTSLSNWAKGGESSLLLLAIGKYNANYSKDKVKWENGAEFRYGITKSKTTGLEKNDDKIEFQSRFGYQAFKKWYYSVESDFKTQIANGYAYPDKVHPISAFMAPGYLTTSIGLDYKPNKDFSLFLSPITSKTTYIRDTMLISPLKYGFPPGAKRLWEPGLIIKSNWHLKISDNITYDTKGEFFDNYKDFFQKISAEWDQTLIMQVNRFINVRVMTMMIYDYNTKFPILDATGTVIGQKPKLQFEELFTLGLVYKF